MKTIIIIIIIILIIFAGNFANSQTLSKKEIREIKKIVISETPDYCFTLLPKKEKTQWEGFKLESFMENGILHLQKREKDLIFVNDTILSFEKESFDPYEVTELLLEFQFMEISKDYWIKYALENGAPFLINNRRVIIPFENKEIIIDFECQAGTIDFNKLKLLKNN